MLGVEAKMNEMAQLKLDESIWTWLNNSFSLEKTCLKEKQSRYKINIINIWYKYRYYRVQLEIILLKFPQIEYQEVTTKARW